VIVEITSTLEQFFTHLTSIALDLGRDLGGDLGRDLGGDLGVELGVELGGDLTAFIKWLFCLGPKGIEACV